MGLLCSDITRYADAVTRNVHVPLSNNQYCALVSFCYNVGIGAFRSSELLIQTSCMPVMICDLSLVTWHFPDRDIGRQRRKKPIDWSRWWVGGWIVILLVAVIYELIAFAFELNGIFKFPTLSSILVGLIPLPILDVLTVIIALGWLWHWHDLKRKRKAKSEKL